MPEGLHKIEEDLEEGLEPWIDEGLCKLETYLESHRLFVEKYGA